MHLKNGKVEKKKKRFDMCMIEMETQEFMTRSIHMPKPPWTMYVYVSSRLAFRIHPFARQPAGFSKYSYLHAKIKYHQRLVFINKKKEAAQERILPLSTYQKIKRRLVLMGPCIVARL